MRILVTGASGFIGSAFVRRLFQGDWGDVRVTAFVRDTDTRNMRRLTGDPGVVFGINCGNLHVVNGDLNGDLSGLCEGIDAVVNFAARTFVDHSILDPRPFVEANVLGTLNLLEDARRNKVKRFIQVSTDEVYGAILNGAYTEDSRLNPTNPYAASKAGADCLAISYANTFGMHTTVTRTENNYGPYQHPQKVFPAFVRRALRGEKLPIYGDGHHVRQWLWVDDHVDALLHLLKTDYAPGQVFHVAGNQELENLDLAHQILSALDIVDMCSDTPRLNIHKKDWEQQIEFISDHNIRPGHDRRYALDCEKLRALGWAPKVDLQKGIQMAVAWYYDNQWWLK